MVSKANVGAGDVELKVGAEKVTLRPTLGAAMKLSTMQGGLTKLVQRCSDLDFDAICDVIIIGGELVVDETTKQRIFEEGMIDLMLPCVQYLNNLANGGKPPREEEGNDEGPLDQNSR
jgi:hypothetical protein